MLTVVGSVLQYDLVSFAYDISWSLAGNYSRLCKVMADLSTMPLTPRKNPAGETYYKAVYDIVLSFGLTELKAQIAWLDENVGVFIYCNIGI